VSILEGESLVNDATALVAFSFALGAVATSTFSPVDAALEFAVIIVGELAYGVLLGWIILHIRHYARDPRAEILLALITPFVAFWPPHEAGGSGVVACVAAGLYVSWNGRKLIRSATRLQGYFIWDLVSWGVEALVFLLMGLQARAIVGKLSPAGWLDFLHAGAIITVTIIVVRFVWIFSSTYFPHVALSGSRPADPGPDWRQPFILGMTGLRGVVSLAAALSIPLTLGGEPFPHRDLVLFVTFFVIVATLVGIGSILSWTVRLLGLDATGHREAVRSKRDERAARLRGIRAVLQELDLMAAEGKTVTSIAALRRQHTDRLALLSVTADETTNADPSVDTAKLQLRLIEAERSTITRLYEENRITDEARRRIERELDLEEARSKHAQASASSIEDELADPAKGDTI
jgi:CPA1 family monovalent cation:H+ antiporter